MLVNFKVRNFLSFSDEQSLSMVPSLEENDDLIKIDNVRLLRKAVIFGANSSGKSNFIKAIAFGRKLVLEGFSAKDRNKFSKILTENKYKESFFEYTFYSRGHFFSYGFSFYLFEGKFRDEYLYVIEENDKDRLVFSRKGKEVEWGNCFRAEEIEVLEKLLLEDTDRLLVNIAGTKTELLEYVREWFSDKLIVNFQDQEFLRLESGLMKNRPQFVRMLKKYDTGITEMGFRKIEEEQLKKHGPEIYARIKEEVAESGAPFGIRLKDALYYIDYSQGPVLFEVYLKHQNSELEYEFGEESDGTKRMFDLIDIIVSPVSNAVYLIDEINRSIHPLLTEEFVLTYKKALRENNVQLLFTTHEANLLREELVRRDEVWFAEKQADASSRIFSLDIFTKENEKDLGKAYLSGRYGGIPLLSSGDE